MAVAFIVACLLCQGTYSTGLIRLSHRDPENFALLIFEVADGTAGSFNGSAEFARASEQVAVAGAHCERLHPLECAAQHGTAHGLAPFRMTDRRSWPSALADGTSRPMRWPFIGCGWGAVQNICVNACRPLPPRSRYSRPEKGRHARALLQYMLALLCESLRAFVRRACAPGGGGADHHAADRCSHARAVLEQLVERGIRPPCMRGC